MRNADFSTPWEASNTSLHQNCWTDWTLRSSQKINSYFPATASFLLELENEPKIPKQCVWPLLLASRALGAPVACAPFPSLAAPHLLVGCPHLVMDPRCGATSPITKLLPGMATRLHLLGNSFLLPFARKQKFGSDHSENFIFSIIGELVSICQVAMVFTKKDVGILYNEQGDLYSNAAKLYISKQVSQVQDKRRWCSMKEVMDLRKSFLKGGGWMQDVFMSSKGRWKSAWRRDPLVMERQSAPGSGSPQAERKQKLGEY